MDNTIKVKFGKIIIAFMFAVTLTFSMGITVFAATSAQGAIGKYATYGSSTITRTTASATTSFASTGTVTVSATYSYINTNTLAPGSSTQNNGNNSKCSVNFNAPTNCRSVRIDSSHSVAAYGQTWTAKTSAVY